MRKWRRRDGGIKRSGLAAPGGSLRFLAILIVTLLSATAWAASEPK